MASPSFHSVARVCTTTATARTSASSSAPRPTARGSGASRAPVGLWSAEATRRRPSHPACVGNPAPAAAPCTRRTRTTASWLSLLHSRHTGTTHTAHNRHHGRRSGDAAACGVAVRAAFLVAVRTYLGTAACLRRQRPGERLQAAVATLTVCSTRCHHPPRRCRACQRRAASRRRRSVRGPIKSGHSHTSGVHVQPSPCGGLIFHHNATANWWARWP